MGRAVSPMCQWLSERPRKVVYAACATAVCFSLGATLLLLRPAPAQEVAARVAPRAKKPSAKAGQNQFYVVRNGRYHYAVCNGFTNQVLCHAGHIAAAMSMNLSVVIPDAFITDGTQSIPDGSVLKNTLPTPWNSVPLGLIFDTEALLEQVQKLGGSATMGSYNEVNVPVCSFLDVLKIARHEDVVKVLKALVPSARMAELVDRIQPLIAKRLSVVAPDDRRAKSQGEGICFHHRDGEDWHRHCDQWERLSPHNGNCRSRRPISELLEYRSSHLRNKGRWVFYAGDHAVPAELQLGRIPVVTREEVFPSAENDIPAHFGGQPGSRLHRDLGAALDFFLCSRLPHFVGNSVSTWSAAQILARDSLASWYNSRFIPLADFIKGYVVPVVYTYTEKSSSMGKLMLQITLLTTLRYMRASAVHVLYHGSEDTDFLSWLALHGITVHDHQPVWLPAAERLREAGLQGGAFQRHRFLSEGNYIGTWQRVDAPLHISAEYCFLLDSDAYVFRQPTFHDLGPDVTATLALAADMNENSRDPGDAGVVLMNIPFMRETLSDFRRFIFSRTTPKFTSGQAHHGAYLDFYGSNITYLDPKFNFKTTYQNIDTWKKAFIVHFHGLKPHDHLRFWFTGTCDPAKCFLLFQFAHNVPFLCGTIQAWARGAMRSEPGLVKAYCEEATPGQVALCVDWFKNITGTKGMARSCKKKLKQVIASHGLRTSDFSGAFAR
ncbi:unnamed protein product [Prorocentrum cordatum]|uniref:Nucleotide-diphospho-sugar transferase domain-containing protein n=1 Tax=Prorocentrum cordatum TaxID=2364126 RepID=A0ABN9X3F1_9DINO|nr:unnamed protein product [Polarella glacialis]